MNKEIISIVLYSIFLSLSLTSKLWALTWDDEYKTVAAAHAASCCSTCSPQYCTYVYCNDDTNESSPILANVNDQCLCASAGGIKRYERGDYVAVGLFPSSSVSNDCIKGIYSTGVTGSTSYTTPTFYSNFKLMCMSDKDTAVYGNEALGIGLGSKICEEKYTSFQRRYVFNSPPGTSTTSNKYYTHIFGCNGEVDPSGYQFQSTNSTKTFIAGCTAQENELYIILDHLGRKVLTSGTEYTATPTPSATATPTATSPMSTFTNTPTFTATNTPTNTPTSTNTPTNTPTPTPACTQDGAPSGAHNIFISSSSPTSLNLGAGHFDTLCATLASNASLQKRYVAIVSRDNSGPLASLLSLPNFNTSGTFYNFSNKIADDLNDFRDGSIDQTIEKTEGQVTISSPVEGTKVITGASNNTGALTSDSCSKWSSIADLTSFSYGNANDPNNWLSSGTLTCDNNPTSSNLRIYCISLTLACEADPTASP